MTRAVQVSVIGSARGEGKILEDAEQVGRILAERGAALVCGGGTGVMEAASRGARSAGGVVLGVLRGTDKREANVMTQANNRWYEIANVGEIPSEPKKIRRTSSF